MYFLIASVLYAEVYLQMNVNMICSSVQSFQEDKMTISAAPAVNALVFVPTEQDRISHLSLIWC